MYLYESPAMHILQFSRDDLQLNLSKCIRSNPILMVSHVIFPQFHAVKSETFEQNKSKTNFFNYEKVRPKI